MHRNLILALLILPVVFFEPTALPESTQGEASQIVGKERLLYEAIPSGGSDREKERLEFDHTLGEGGSGTYLSRIFTTQGIEEFTLLLDHVGRLVSARKVVSHHSGRGDTHQKIWREDRKIFVQTADQKPKEIRLPQDSLLVANGSILIQLRSFPFDQGRSWKLFMVDFEGRSFSADLRQVGREKIDVPAGEFDCYRLELKVDVPLLNLRSTFWLDASEPHILVKYEGKRGLFSPKYVTYLVSKQGFPS